MVAKSPKIAKNAKKVDFLRGRFFDDFLGGQKIEKRRHAHHRGMSSPSPGLHWGTRGETTNNPLTHCPSCLRQVAAPGRVAEVLLMQQLAIEPRGTARNHMEACGKL